MHRRSFLALTAGSAGGVVLGPSVAGVGGGDVLRLRQQLDALMALDDSRGGHNTLERVVPEPLRPAGASPYGRWRGHCQVIKGITSRLRTGCGNPRREGLR
ncbi:hypothetical protein ACF07T_38230 [Streptomyces sp. NPDC015184]|uniref:hypothetical protein n=1 Tax=Streptomyces sp. NPDC015184 TaxID=3364946 RepID=UPI0036F5F545